MSASPMWAMMVGMLILMVVAFLIVSGLAVMAYRKRLGPTDTDGGSSAD